MYAKKHPVIASANSIGQKFVGGVPDAIQYISANIDKKYNGGDGYVNPDTTETAKSEAIRQSVSEKSTTISVLCSIPQVWGLLIQL